MNTKKYLIVGIMTTMLIGVTSLAVAASIFPAPMVLQISSSGGVLLRGTVTAVAMNSLTVKSWGGDWVVNIPASATLSPERNMSQFNVGDFVGVRGVINQGVSWTVDASLVRNWTTKRVNKSAPTINFIQPSVGVIGTSVTITGSGFTATGNKIKFGNLGSENNPTYSLNSSDGKTLMFTVPSGNYLSCWSSVPACMAPQYMTQPGSYQVSVINSNGQSNEVSFSVVFASSSCGPCGNYCMENPERAECLIKTEGFKCERINNVCTKIPL